MANKQSWRGFVSLTIFISGLISAITGIILYIVPQGRVAYWVIWELLGLTKTQWGSIHTLSSFLFMIFMVLHILNNWSTVMNYIRKKAGGINMKRELLAAVLMSIIIVVSAIWALPPLQWIIDFGEEIKQAWVTKPEFEPPFGHAEEVKLKPFCRRMDIKHNEAVAALKAGGMKLDGENQTILDIAKANNITPMDVYALIKHLEGKLAVEKGKIWTDDEIEAKFAGMGLGRWTFDQLLEKTGVNRDVALEKLKAAGIEIAEDEKMKSVKDRYELEAVTDLLKIILK